MYNLNVYFHKSDNIHVNMLSGICAYKGMCRKVLQKNYPKFPALLSISRKYSKNRFIHNWIIQKARLTAN